MIQSNVHFFLAKDGGGHEEIAPRQEDAKTTALRIMAAEMEELLRAFGDRRRAWPEATSEPMARATPTDTAHAARIMGRMLLGERTHGEWMSQREALDISAASLDCRAAALKNRI